MKLSVFYTPELTPETTLADCAIAVDVLRATSTIVTALSSGAEAVQVFSDLDKLLKVSEDWSSAKRIRAGERGGSKVEGFDFGNSPLDCTPERVGGKRLFISTTNGTRALQCVQTAPTVLAAALINREAVVQHLLQHQPETVWIVGSGWEGSFSLEDTVCAGAIAHQLQTKLGCSLEELAENDEVVGAIALYQQWQDNLLDLMHHASHGKRLLRLGCDEDLKYCSQTDVLDVLPMQREPGVLINSKSLVPIG
ncbi:2-phosphosulfolactate phosphatase family protein [Leptothermofonsia sichuanensis E412]|jgi:2-phosphosulfolactate phosphatase|uniref:2-phosphosulfolactate phosphatase family protein n=1 Tax=Leptothermofonsia sichuanensis TaxID=2917832 RepID=UPI001CA738D8|nr:2-phosphosulfolactate phosphatase family protein [Leptothermofonsia sichuanensis]QZZ19258.1 2-phosphosulfolactate phosphatase family protein [Leptothermofonsia sichuanensis E412]